MSIRGIDILLAVEDRELLGAITRSLEQQPLLRVSGTVNSPEDIEEALRRTDPHCVFLSGRLAVKLAETPPDSAIRRCLRLTLLYEVSLADPEVEREIVAPDPTPAHMPLRLAGRLGFPCDGRGLFQQLSRRIESEREAASHWLRRDERKAPGFRQDGPQAFLIQGAKGGVGASFLAARLAAFVARHKNTLLIDFDLHAAPHADLFETAPRRSLADVLPLGVEINSGALDSAIRPHPAGFNVLPAPPEAERAVGLAGSDLSDALQAIFMRQDVTIVDIPPGLDEVSACLHILCSRSLLVSTPDVLSVRALGRGISLLRRLSLGGERLGLLLNRATPQTAIGPAQVESYLKLPVLASFDEDTLAGLEFAEMGRIPSSVRTLRETALLAEALELPAEAPVRSGRPRLFRAAIREGAR